MNFATEKKIKNTHFHSTFIDLFPRFPGNIYKTVCSTEFQMNTDFIFTKYPFYLPMSTELSFELNGIEQISSTKCNDFNFYKWNWFFPFSFAFFSHRARTHTHNHFSRNEEIRCELKGERVETSKIGFLCYLKNVQLPFIYFALFAGCYLSVWIFFLLRCELNRNPFHCWRASSTIGSEKKKFLIELIVKWILIPFFIDILFMALFRSVTFRTSVKNEKRKLFINFFDRAVFFM